MTEKFFLPLIKSDISASDIESLYDTGVLKNIFTSLMRAEILKNIDLTKEEKLEAVKNFSLNLKLSEKKMKILERKDPGLQNKIRNEAIIRRKTEIFYRDSFHKKAEKFFYENEFKFNQYIYSLLRNNDRNTIYELYYQVESRESSINELAKKYSIGNEKSRKGLIGPVSESDIHPKILNYLKSSGIGIISEPFQIANTWYIIQQEEFIQASFDKTTKNKISNHLFEEELELHYENFIKKHNINKFESNG